MKNIFFYLILLYYRIEFIIFQLVPYTFEKSILIIRLDAIGDAVIWFDTAKEYRKHFPNKHLVLLCNIAWKEIAEVIPYFDEVITIDKNKFLYKFIYRSQILLKLKKRKFEKIINPVFSRDFFTQDVLVHNLRSSKKIGYQGDYNNTSNTLRGFGNNFVKYTSILEQISLKWYSQIISNNVKTEMELSRNAHFIRKFLDDNFSSQLPSISFPLPIFSNLPQNYIVIFIGASTKRKLWNANNYQKLISKISNENIIICGGKGEEDIWLNIEKELNTNKNITNLIGKTTLLELFTIIRKAHYIITNDTSASHITVAVKTPSVCLLGGAHFGRFQPYQVEEITKEDKKYLPKVVYNKMDCFGCNTFCKYIKDKKTIWPCIDGITVEQVIEKIKEIENDYNNIV